MEYDLLHFEVKGDKEGKLISLEENKNIPFDIKRVYYIYDTRSDVVRGNHAHKNLRQVIVALHGSCTFLLDDGTQKKTITLHSPDTGLYIGRNLWREMYDFSPDCVLIVMASEYYDENEYIRDYPTFLQSLQ